MFPQVIRIFRWAERPIRLAVAFALALSAIAIPLIARSGTPAQAAPPHDFALAKTDDKGGEALIGEHVTYTLTAQGTQASGAYLYNLSFRDVLPAGVAFVSANPAPTAVLNNVPAAGQTTLIWENTTDLPANSFASVSYVVDTNPDFGGGFSGSGTNPVGATVTNSAQAVASIDAFLIPDWSPATGQFTGDFNGTASANHNVVIAPFRVKKSGPGELLRGVHGSGFGDRGGTSGATYTIEVQNNPDYPTNAVSVLDTLSPMLEFLGCNPYYGADDNSTDVPFRESTAVADEEWAGSGPMATDPASGTCVTPDSVTTVGTGTANLANTEVRWTVGNLAPNQTYTITYRAGIPMHANTTTWTTAGGAPTPASLQQGRNLDNNAGPATNELDRTLSPDPELLVDGAPNVPNTASATGTYAPNNTAYTKQKTHDTESEDIVIGKSMTGSLSHGTLVNSALTISTSEYRDFTNLTVRDLMPSPLCFLGSYVSDVTAGGSDWASNDCAGQGSSPSLVGGNAEPAHRVRELPTGGPYGSGRFEVLWNYQTNPELVSLKSDQTITINYQSRVRTTYRGNLQKLPGEPVLAGDEVTNAAEVEGPDWVVSEHTNNGGADPEAGGGVDGDTTGASLTNPLPSINKRISAKAGPLADGAGATAATCGVNHSTITWQEGLATGFGPGDIVCFELGATFASTFDYENTKIFDLLPQGYSYVPGSAARISAIDNLPGTTFTEPPVGAQQLQWDLHTVNNAGHTFRWVIAATLGVPNTAVAKDIHANLEKMIHNQNGGVVFQYRDEVPAEWTEPQVRIAKGVAQVNAADNTLDSGPHGPDFDNSTGGGGTAAIVQSLADVTYRLDVWNNGNETALDTEVWDRLPAGITCASVSAISNAGTCAAGVIKWSGLTVGDTTTMATAPVTLTYHVLVPIDVAAGVTFQNTAGVRTYQSTINNGTGRYVYYPANNIDGTVTPNTDRADDPAWITTPLPPVAKTQASGIAEAGNGSNGTPATAADLATPGEVVRYDITFSVPDGTSLYQAVLTDNLPAGMTYFAGSARFGGSTVVVGKSVTSSAFDANDVRLDSGTLTTPAVGSGGAITYTLPTTYHNAAGSGADTAVITVYARADAGNRGDTRTNQATLTWKSLAAGGVDLGPSASNTVTTTIVEPNPAVTKTHTAPIGTIVAPGATITYQVAAANVAAANVSVLHNVSLVDNVPDGVTPLKTGGGLVSSTGDLVASAGVSTPGAFSGVWDQTFRTITWTPANWAPLTSIAPGAAATFTYQVHVDDPATASGSLTNTVTLTGSNLVPSDPNYLAGRFYNTNDAETLVLPAASIIKDVEPLPDDSNDRATFAVGETADYDIEVTIPSDTIVYDATVFDQLPSGLTFDSFGTPTFSGPCQLYPAGTPLTAAEIERFAGPVGGQAGRNAWFIGDVRANGGNCVITLPYTVHVNATVGSGATLVNSSTLVWNVTNEVASANPAVLPTGYDNPTSTSWDIGLAPVTQTIGVIEPKLELDEDVTLAAGTAIPPCNVTPGNNRSGANDLDTQTGLTDGCDVSAAAGLRYTLSVTNVGTGPAHDVTVTDVVPAGVIVLAAPGGAPVADGGTVTGLGGPVGIWSATNRTITWTFTGPIAVNGRTTLHYDAVLAPSAQLQHLQDFSTNANVPAYYGLDAATRSSITNTDVPKYGNGPGATRNPVFPDVDTVEVHFPQPTINKVSVSDATDARFDQPFTFTITAGNSDTAASLFNADVVDTLPFGWVYVANSAQVTTPYHGAQQINPTIAGSTLTWTDLVAGAGQPLTSTGTITITFAATPVKATLAPDASTGILNTGPTHAHVNQARVTGEDASGAPGCCDSGAGAVPYAASDSESVYIRRADLSVTKTLIDALPVSYGDIVTYKVVLTNSGPSTATGVTLQDLLATDLTYQSTVRIDAGTYTNATGVWNVGSIASGTSYELHLRVKIDKVGAITNTAAVKTADQWDPDSTPGNNAPAEDDQASVTIDAQFVSLGNRVWLDLDSDGVQDPTEPGIPNVPVAISWLDADSTLQVRVVNTDIDGNWSVVGLPVATPITVTVDPGNPATPAGTGGGGTALAGLAQTWELIDNPNLAASQAANGHTTGLNHEVTGIVLSQAIPGYVDVDFGYVGINSVGDAVWFDLDGGGEAAPEAGDYPLANVALTVRWAGFDGVFANADDLTFPATTNASGNYLVGGLPDGQYRVEIDPATLPTALTPTFDLNGPATAHTSGQFALGVGVTPPENRRDVDFAYTGPGSVGDTVWFDQDRDGVLDPAEVPLAGVTVTLTYTLPGHPPVVLTTTTDSSGHYLFDHLPLGVPLTVAVDQTTLPAGFNTQTYDLDGVGTAHTASVTLTSSIPNRTDVDFGYAGTSALGDFVWFDVDGNGLAAPGAGEPPIAGATVTLRWTNPTGGADMVLTTTTGTDGKYLFPNLPAGSFTVTVSNTPAGMTATYDADGGNDLTSTVRLGVDQTILTQDFSLTGTGTLGDTLWHDVDGDGAIDAGEPRLGAVTVRVVWTDPANPANTYTWTLSTAPDGTYLATKLPAGNYRITIDPATLPSGMVPTYDRDGTADNTTQLRLAAGETNLTADFGYGLDADLAITKTHTGAFRIGEENTWELTVRNFGPAIAQAPVTITDDLPSGIEFVRTTGTDWTCASVGQKVTCTYTPGPMAVNGTSSLSVVVKPLVAAAPSVTNEASVTSPTPDSKRTNNVARDVTSVPFASLSITKSLDGTLRAGATASYVLKVTNHGPSATSGTVVVTDELPSGLSYVSSIVPDNWFCSNSGPTVTCTTSTPMGVGDTATLTIETRVDAAPGSSVINKAIVSGGNLVDGQPLPVAVSGTSEHSVSATVSGRSLAFTGNRQSGGYLLTALWSVLVGATLVLIARRRPRYS